MSQKICQVCHEPAIMVYPTSHTHEGEYVMMCENCEYRCNGMVVEEEG